MERDKVEEVINDIQESLTPDQLIMARGMSTLAKMIQGNTTVSEICKSLVEGYKEESLPDEYALQEEDFSKQLMDGGILAYLEDNKLILVKNNAYAITGLGLVMGYTHHLLLVTNQHIPAELVLQLLVAFVKDKFSRELNPTTFFEKEDLIKLFKDFTAEFISSASTQH